jgi:hypothetical protein
MYHLKLTPEFYGKNLISLCERRKNLDNSWWDRRGVSFKSSGKYVSADMTYQTINFSEVLSEQSTAQKFYKDHSICGGDFLSQELPKTKENSSGESTKKYEPRPWKYLRGHGMVLLPGSTTFGTRRRPPPLHTCRFQLGVRREKTRFLQIWFRPPSQIWYFSQRKKVRRNPFQKNPTRMCVSTRAAHWPTLLSRNIVQAHSYKTVVDLHNGRECPAK